MADKLPQHPNAKYIINNPKYQLKNRRRAVLHACAYWGKDHSTTGRAELKFFREELALIDKELLKHEGVNHG